MKFRTEPDIAQVQREVQQHLSDLAKRGLNAPLVPKPKSDVFLRQSREPDFAEGFAEEQQRLIKKPE